MSRKVVRTLARMHVSHPCDAESDTYTATAFSFQQPLVKTKLPGGTNHQQRRERGMGGDGRLLSMLASDSILDFRMWLP